MKKIQFKSTVSLTLSALPKWNTCSASIKYNASIIFHIRDSEGCYELNYGYPNGDVAELWYTQRMQPIDNVLYGMIHTGGSNLLGYLFQYNPVNSTFTKKIQF